MGRSFKRIFRGISAVEIAVVAVVLTGILVLAWPRLEAARERYLRDQVAAAVKNEDTEQLKSLLRGGAPVDVWTSASPHFCALCWALWKGDAETVKLAVENEEFDRIMWQTDHPRRLEQQLIISARNGEADKVMHLLNAGVRPRGLRHGGNALHWAAKNGHAQIVEMLLTTEMNPGALDGNMRCAAELAREAGHDALAERIDVAAAAWEAARAD